MAEEHHPSFTNPWATEGNVDISTVFRSCLGYATTPAWAFIQQVVLRTFHGFEGLETIELGCGEGKASLLFYLLGAKTTLVDNSPAQLERAKYIAARFAVDPLIVEENLLHLPKSFSGRFDVSMSFGTAEHFFGQDRQHVFDVHRSVLRKGGLAIIWVPNRYGVLFHVGVVLRKLFTRKVSEVPETPFTRKELHWHAKRAGLLETKVIGGESLVKDFNNFIFDLQRLLRLPQSQEMFADVQTVRNKLLRCLLQNNTSIKPWNNLFSYPLVLIGRNI